MKWSKYYKQYWALDEENQWSDIIKKHSLKSSQRSPIYSDLQFKKLLRSNSLNKNYYRITRKMMLA